MLIDTHAHLTYDALYANIEDVLKRAQDAGIRKIMNICTDVQTLERGIELAIKHPWIYNIAATTPHDVETQGEDFDFFEKCAKEKKLIAIGETGLDYFYERSPREKQKEFLLKYMQLALSTHLPLVIHCRDAFEDLFSLADAHYKIHSEMQKLLLHCFTGTLSDVKKALDRGFLISFSGIVTFKKSTGLQEVARFVPIDRMVIETDAPYLAPQSKRGQVNEPSYIKETALFLSELKGLSLEEFGSATTKNALDFFRTQKIS